LKIYAGEKILLEALHPDAYKQWTFTHDIKDVVDRALGKISASNSLNLSQELDIDKLIASSDEETSDKVVEKLKKKKNLLSDSDDDEKPKKKDKGKKKADSDSDSDVPKKKKKAKSDSDDSDDEKPKKKDKGKKKKDDSDDERPNNMADSDMDVGDVEDKPMLMEDSDEEMVNGKKRKKKQKVIQPAKKIKLSLKLKLGTPVKPMLARASKSFDDAIKRCPNGFYTELKYDGERIQIHFDRDAKEPLHCYSRNLKPMMAYKVEEIQDYIPKCIKDSVKRVILDGEILLIDTITNKPLPFGTLGKNKKTQFKNANVAIFLFDILYYEGKSLFEVPLYKRRKLMQKCVKEIPHRILLGEAFVCNGSRENRETLLANKMRSVIEEGEEGLVLKDMCSIYEPNARHWLKIKKDYLKGMADSADLLVLGAYFGTGSKGGLLSVYLMGCYDKKSKTYKTVCRCGNGHNDETIERLDKELRKKMKQINADPDKIPDWFECDRPLTPDFVIKDPKDTVVWEISGAEFTETDRHPSGISIRFPRVTKIRDDKDVDDHTNLEELKALFKASKKKAAVAFDANIAVKPGVSPKKSKKSKKDDDDDNDGDDDSDDDKKKKKKDKKKKKADSDEDNSDSDDDKKKKKKNKDDKKSKKDDKPSESDDEFDKVVAKNKGDITYVYGELDKVANAQGHKIVAHVVDDSGRWSDRGTMGILQKLYGDAAQALYGTGALELGKIQTDRVSKGHPHIVICNLIAQEFKKKGEASALSYEHLESSLKSIGKLILREEKNVAASIGFHFARIHHGVPNLKWEKVEKLLEKHLMTKGINVTIYTKDRDDKDKVGKKKEKQPEKKEEEVEKKEKKEKKPEKIEDKMDVDDKTDDELDVPAPKSVPKEEILKGCCVVISGYSPDETGEIAEKIENMGGVVQTKWKLIGLKSTHLVCESFTEAYDHVSNLGSTIVNRVRLF
jgi:DNA ligase-3